MNSRRSFFRDLAREVAAVTAPPAEPPKPALSDAELERYSRQLVMPEWSERAQLALREASVLVVGAGALGSPVAMHLAGAGVGKLGIVDADEVELSNLHRQHLHFTPDVGVPKAHSAAAKLGFLNPETVVEPYQVRLEAENAAGLIEGSDLVVDCSDSFETRYAVNAACCAAGVPLVEGGALGMGGLVMAVRPGETACYRCAFPEAPLNAPSCADRGRPRPRGERDRLAAGARGDQAADRRGGAAAGRLPAGRPRDPRLPAGEGLPPCRTAPTARVRTLNPCSAPCAGSRARCGGTSRPRATATPRPPA